MKLKSLELRNFRPYYGNVNITFPTSEDASICLIHGLNGYGKTSLFMALNWCLYGHDRQKDAFEFFNTKARSEPNACMSVRMVLDNDGHEMAVFRRIQCEKPITTVRDLGKTELAVFEDSTKRHAQDEQVLQEMVSDLLPREASQFSFFDGDKIEMYSSDDANEATRDAISSVLGLSLLSRSKDDLEKLATLVNTDRRRLLEREVSGKALADDMATLDANIEEARKQKAEREADSKSLQSQQASLQEQLAAQESARALSTEISKLEESIQEAEKAKLGLASAIKDATRDLYLGVLEPVLLDQLAEAQRRRDSLTSLHLDVIRLEAGRALLSTIVETGICICGRPADEAHMQRIRTMLDLPDDEKKDGGNTDSLDDVRWLVSRLDSAVVLCREHVGYAEVAAKLAGIENEVDEWATSLAAKKDRLGGIDEEAIASLAEVLERVGKERIQAEREIGSLEKTISDYIGDRKTMESRISKISGQVQGLELLTAQVVLLEKSAAAFEEIVRRSALAKQDEIQTASTHFFRQITNKVFAYERLVINDDFSFGVETVAKTRPPMALISAGEKQVTALSFILGLNEYTRRQAPIVVDTPMGRLDETHRRNVAKVLLELAQKGRQIVLLVTDTELAFGVYEMLKPGVGAEFEIVHDQTDLTSRLERRQQ